MFGVYEAIVLVECIIIVALVIVIIALAVSAKKSKELTVEWCVDGESVEGDSATVTYKGSEYAVTATATNKQGNPVTVNVSGATATDVSDAPYTFTASVDGKYTISNAEFKLTITAQGLQAESESSSEGATVPVEDEQQPYVPAEDDSAAVESITEDQVNDSADGSSVPAEDEQQSDVSAEDDSATVGSVTEEQTEE